MSETVRDELIRVCHPRRFPGMSGKMAGLLALLLNTDEWSVDPPMTYAVITSDGFLLVGDGLANEMIGGYSDFVDNIRRLYEVTQDSELPMSGAGLAYLLKGVNSLRQGGIYA